MVKLIAFKGLKECGKSTTANFLINERGFTLINMKKAINSELKDLFPETMKSLAESYEMTVDEFISAKPPLLRPIQKDWGMYRRSQDENYWVSKWLHGMESVHGGMSIVVDDIRFQNEAEVIKTLGGVIVEVIKEGMVSDDNHATETSSKDIKADHVISAAPGEVEKLCEQIDKIWKTLE